MNTMIMPNWDNENPISNSLSTNKSATALECYDPDESPNCKFVRRNKKRQPKYFLVSFRKRSRKMKLLSDNVSLLPIQNSNCDSDNDHDDDQSDYCDNSTEL